MDFEFYCEKANLEAINSREMRVNVENADVSVFSSNSSFMDDVMSHYPASEAVNHYETEEILKELDEDEIIKYLESNGYEVTND